MLDMINPFLQWLNAHPGWAFLVTFLISTSESIAIIGTIVPGSITMTAIGTLAGSGVIPIFWTILVAIIGAIVGDGISYMLGYYYTDRIRSIWPFRSNPSWLLRGETFFKDHGKKSVFMGRFVGPLRAIVPLIAGMLKMKPLHFYFANILSAIVWAPAYMLPGILLGVASLELPPDIAVHIIVALFLGALFFILCLWILFEIIQLIGRKIEEVLCAIWEKLDNAKVSHPLTILLQHHDRTRGHGQLILAFYFLIALFGLIYLTHYIAMHNSVSVFLNDGMFHFFRSLRRDWLDTVMLFITMLGEPMVIIPLWIIACIGLVFIQRTYLMWHVLALGVVAILGIDIMQHVTHVARPWGIVDVLHEDSFPSTHVIFASLFYVGIGLFLSHYYSHRGNTFMYVGIAIVLLISLSKLYFGLHWVTDVIAAWLLSAVLLMLVIIAYNRKQDTHQSINGLLGIMLGLFVILYSITSYCDIGKMKQRFALKEYPVHSVMMQNWWNQTDNQLPKYRINRFGLAIQPFNIQWLGDLESIRHTLLNNGWQVPPERDWVSIVQRLTDIQSTEIVPLVSPIYLDKRPSLIFIKPVEDGRLTFVLRIWPSTIVITEHNKPLWVGTVTIIPRTYDWLFKDNAETISISKSVVFSVSAKGYEIKAIPLPVLSRKRVETGASATMLLVRSEK